MKTLNPYSGVYRTLAEGINVSIPATKEQEVKRFLAELYDPLRPPIGTLIIYQQEDNLTK